MIFYGYKPIAFPHFSLNHCAMAAAASPLIHRCYYTRAAYCSFCLSVMPFPWEKPVWKRRSWETCFPHRAPVYFCTFLRYCIIAFPQEICPVFPYFSCSPTVWLSRSFMNGGKRFHVYDSHGTHMTMRAPHLYCKAVISTTFNYFGLGQERKTAFSALSDCMHKIPSSSNTNGALCRLNEYFCPPAFCGSWAGIAVRNDDGTVFRNRYHACPHENDMSARMSRWETNECAFAIAKLVVLRSFVKSKESASPLHSLEHAVAQKNFLQCPHSIHSEIEFQNCAQETQVRWFD